MSVETAAAVTTVGDPGETRWERWRRTTTAGGPLFPLVVLFGLNMVDELDRTAFGVLTPDIRDHFGLSLGGILTVIALSTIVALIIAVPIGFYADRLPRIPLMVAGASLWAVFSATTGIAAGLWMLGISRAGAGLGRAVNDPVHNALLADYYDIPVRNRVYSIHRYANPFGQLVGAVSAGLLAKYFGWRLPFILYAFATAIFITLALKLRDPGRGHFERRAMGASEEVVATEEVPPSWAESWRVVWAVRSQRRIYYALPFVAIGFIGLVSLGGLYYEQIFNLDSAERGYLVALVEGPAQLFGLIVGIPLATRLMLKGPGHVMGFLAKVSILISGVWVIFAYAPNLPIAVAANSVMSAAVFMLIPGIFAVMSLAVPAKVRSFGYAMGALWVLPGLLALPFIGAIGDAHGLRLGLLCAAPIFLVGGLILASAGTFVADDINRVWRTSATLSEVAHLRKQGKVKLLVARDVSVHYGPVQVLFGVDLEVDEGEIVALLGTNGAGKSTLLKAISGLVEASDGAIIFDGRDMTHTPPDEVAKRGVAQVPGGQGVFTQLSVADNLRLAGWRQDIDDDELRIATERVLETFPVLRERWHVDAGDLSGGQQQMLTLGMAFIGRPRLLMIDELSLGLSPAVVGQLLEMVRMLREQGTTIILVEQSVNVALTVAERAYFMEKGEIRFEGPTEELLARPDLLRSVFFSAASPIAVAPELEVEAKPNGAAGNGEEAPLPVLEVREIVKRFGGVRALDGVSFDVAPNEILGFIGPNGAGKTTLFDVLSGFDRQHQSGTIRLRSDGNGHGDLHDLHDLPTHARSWRGLGRSFQDGRLFPGLTVTETIAVALEQHVEVRDPIAATLRLPAVADSEEQVDLAVADLVDLLGLGSYRDKFVRELSTGTRRIVDLACVLAQGPKVVLLDEPSSGIAQREAEALGPVLRRVREELGASLLVIEHDLPLLLSIADRMIALDLGRLVVDGDPHEVINHPTVVESYLGTDASAIARSGAH